MKKSGVLVLALIVALMAGIALIKSNDESLANAKIENRGPDAGIITIGTFNIQIFGQAKASKQDVMDVLAKTAVNFDVLAIDEFRDEKGTVFPLFLEAINNISASGYRGIIGPRLGRTASKEQYAYIYNDGKLELLGAYTYDDKEDRFHREPFIAQFKSRNGNFGFVLIAIHTDPDEAKQEIADLALAVNDAREKFPNERNFMLLGDLNADCDYFNVNSDANNNIELKSRGYVWLISDGADTTTKNTNCAYDRIIITRDMAGKSTGRADVFRFDKIYGLNQNFTQEVSDHYPVWATFNVG